MQKSNTSSNPNKYVNLMVNKKYIKGIIFFVLGLVATSIGVIVIIDLIIGPKNRLTNAPGKISSFIIMLGLFSLVYGIASLLTTRKDIEVESMTQSDLVNIFDCPRSGNKGVISVIKIAKNQIIVKFRCPSRDPRHVKIPLKLLDQCLPEFRDLIFRCFKCGKEATVDRVKLSRPWTLLKLSCPTHGNKLPTYKIWSSVYSDITKEVVDR